MAGLLWSLIALGVIAIAFIADYAAQNCSGHTHAAEPLALLVLFVPLTLVGAFGIASQARRRSLCALAVGLAGVALIITLDRTDRLVQYSRWIHRGGLGQVHDWSTHWSCMR